MTGYPEVALAVEAACPTPRSVWCRTTRPASAPRRCRPPTSWPSIGGHPWCTASSPAHSRCTSGSGADDRVGSSPGGRLRPDDGRRAPTGAVGRHRHRASDGRIVAVGPIADLGSPPPVVERIGGLLMPGLVNAHAHTPMTLVRSVGNRAAPGDLAPGWRLAPGGQDDAGGCVVGHGRRVDRNARVRRHHQLRDVPVRGPGCRCRGTHRRSGRRHAGCHRRAQPRRPGRGSAGRDRRLPPGSSRPRRAGDGGVRPTFSVRPHTRAVWGDRIGGRGGRRPAPHPSRVPGRAGTRGRTVRPTGHGAAGG